MAKKSSKASSASPSKKTSKKKVTKKKTTRKATGSSSASSTSKKPSSAPAASRNGKKTAATKPASPKPAESGNHDKPKKKKKSPLNKRELDRYRNMLLIKRAELRGDIDSMQAEALLNHDSANLSHMPIHMADIGSDQHDQELTLNLVESERKMLNEIEESLHRIQEGTYGICEVSGEPIAKARLDAQPWAKYSVEVAREMERKNPPPRR